MASSRRLSAIMFTDMVGYTARTQADEAGTLELLRQQEALVQPLLGVHHGRAVKSTGDGVLAEFPSALEAARCAVAIQEELHRRNEVAGRPRIEIRIGIHLGDVEERNDDIFGDAVNIAARVQPTADVGGIAVSQQVYDQIRNKIGLPLEPLGSKSLKGVRLPMGLYRILLPWNVRARDRADAAEPPRLAVLPFSNISPDPKDAYFSDGLTEEVIAVLSQLGRLRVIARTSVEPYRTTPKPIPDIGVELGVQWVVEGSVRKAGNRLRITVQLIDVASQEHLWTETYNRELDDVFALQVEMAKHIADALQLHLAAGESSRLERRVAPRPDSYLAYLEGRSRLKGIAEDDVRAAQGHFERALALDPSNAAAHAALADTLRLIGELYPDRPREETERRSREHAARALEIDPELAEAHGSLALAHTDAYEFAEAEVEFRRAIGLNPSSAWAHQWYADLLAGLGRVDLALEEYAIARQLDPLSALVVAQEIGFLAGLGRLEDAERELEALRRIEPSGLLYHDRRSTLCFLRGDAEGYRREVDVLRGMLPGRSEVVIADAAYEVLVGNHPRARELVRSVEGLPEPVRPDVQIATLYALLGDAEATFRWLDTSVSERRIGPITLRYAQVLAPYRSDPRFSQLLRRLRLDPSVS